MIDVKLSLHIIPLSLVSHYLFCLLSFRVGQSKSDDSDGELYRISYKIKEKQFGIKIVERMSIVS